MISLSLVKNYKVKLDIIGLGELNEQRKLYFDSS